MSTANKLTYLNDTKQLLKQKINNLGGDITDNTTFRQYADKLQTIYDNAPKTDYEEGSNITLENCLKGKLDFEDDIVGYGDTEQAILPSEYQQVEYLEGTGAQYINTGVKLDVNSIIDIKYRFVDYGFVFGSRNTNSTEYSGITNESTNIYNVRMGNTVIYTTQPVLGGTITVHIENANTFVNNVKSTTAFGNSYYNGSCFLFTINNFGVPGPAEYSKNRIYYFKIQDKIELIPCYRKSDDVIGMYDLVSNTFFTNAGTGTFTKGADVPTPSVPVPINIVTGEQEIIIRGKNKLKINDVTLTSNGVTLTVQDNYLILNGTNNGTESVFQLSNYITPFKTNSNTKLKAFQISGTASGSLTNTFFRTYSNWTNQVNVNFTQTTISSYSAELTYNNCMLALVGGTYTNYKIGIMVADNLTSDDTYEPYITPITKTLNLGNIEFAEIGTYRDELFTDRSTGKWYKHSEIRKRRITGNDIDNLRYSNPANNCYQYRTAENFLSDLQVNPDPFHLNDTAFCNYAIKNGDINDLNNYHFTVSGNKAFCINTPYNTLENMRAWVNNVELILYYQLATATDTEITDTSLINQLEDIYNIMSLNGTTIIEIEGDLPMIMKVRALKND